MNDFKDNLKEIRKSKKLTQVELAKMSGLTPDWISQFETGRRDPSIKILVKIANSLEVTLDSLIGR